MKNRKARYNEVPQEYRRNYTKEFANFYKTFLLIGYGILFFSYMFVHF